MKTEKRYPLSTRMLTSRSDMGGTGGEMKRQVRTVTFVRSWKLFMLLSCYGAESSEWHSSISQSSPLSIFKVIPLLCSPHFEWMNEWLNQSDHLEFGPNVELTCHLIFCRILPFGELIWAICCLTCLPLLILFFSHFLYLCSAILAPNIVCGQVCNTRV